MKVIELLDDDYARAILVATSEQPMSATTLSEEIDASLPTVYRRLEWLEDAGMVDAQTVPDSEGHHYRVYRSRLRRFAVELDDGALEATIDLRGEHVADRFTRLYEGLR